MNYKKYIYPNKWNAGVLVAVMIVSFTAYYGGFVFEACGVLFGCENIGVFAIGYPIFYHEAYSPADYVVPEEFSVPMLLLNIVLWYGLVGMVHSVKRRGARR